MFKLVTSMDEFGKYAHELESPEWKIKRKQIIERDLFKCSCCGKTNSIQLKNGIYCGLDFGTKPIITNEIIHCDRYSIKEFKSSFSVETLRIFDFKDMKSHINPKYIPFESVGLTDDGRLVYTTLSADFFKNNRYKSVKDNLYIFSYYLRNGQCYFFLSDSLLEKGKTLPVLYISEDPITLNVHHKYYVYTAKAWEYPGSALITLCDHCHKKLHDTQEVKVYSSFDLKIPMNFTPCLRCNGAGRFPEYKHIEGGICFRCRGARYEELIEKSEKNSIENTMKGYRPIPHKDDLPF